MKTALETIFDFVVQYSEGTVLLSGGGGNSTMTAVGGGGGNSTMTALGGEGGTTSTRTAVGGTVLVYRIDLAVSDPNYFPRYNTIVTGGNSTMTALGGEGGTTSTRTAIGGTGSSYCSLHSNIVICSGSKMGGVEGGTTSTRTALVGGSDAGGTTSTRTALVGGGVKLLYDEIITLFVQVEARPLPAPPLVARLEPRPPARLSEAPVSRWVR